MSHSATGDGERRQSTPSGGMPAGRRGGGRVELAELPPKGNITDDEKRGFYCSMMGNYPTVCKSGGAVLDFYMNH